MYTRAHLLTLKFVCRHMQSCTTAIKKTWLHATLFDCGHILSTLQPMITLYKPRVVMHQDKCDQLSNFRPKLLRPKSKTRADPVTSPSEGIMLHDVHRNQATPSSQDSQKDLSCFVGSYNALQHLLAPHKQSKCFGTVQKTGLECGVWQSSSLSHTKCKTFFGVHDHHGLPM